MSALSTSAGGSQKRGPLAFLTGQVLKYVGLALLDAIAIVIVYSLASREPVMALVIAIITAGMNVLILMPQLYPLRWMSPGLALMTLLVIYPIIFTVYTAFTNYGDGHLYTKDEAIALHEQRTFVAEDAPRYQWTAYLSEANETDLALWLTRGEGDALEVLFAVPGEEFEVIDTTDPTPPESYNGYRQLERRELGRFLGTLQDTTFGKAPEAVSVTSREAMATQQRYVYDAELDAIEDMQTGEIYYANNEEGTFVTPDRDTLEPGFRVSLGFENFVRFLESPALRGPLVGIFFWTVVFAALSVLTTFALGLFMALIMNAPGIRGRKLIQSMLIIPYAIPGVISILVWRGMMNPTFGILQEIGLVVPWFNDAFWAKIAVLLVNLWLGYPYMMLINSGALQSIPSDIYEAAAVDGANNWQRFWRITLPLLLVTVGPLLIASFTYNFNNYVIIEALTEGGPPMTDVLIPAGHTDILISYTYEMAFGTGHGADYGLASAITIIIFAIVAAVTLLQFRFTGQWEEVSENV